MSPVKGEQNKSTPLVTAADTAGELSDEPSRLLFRAYQDLLAERQQGSIEAQKRTNEAYFDMLAAQDRARREAWAPVKKAYEALCQAQSEAARGAEEGQQRYQQALEDYQRAQEELSTSQDLAERCAAAFRSYTQAQKEAWDESHTRSEKARQGYVSVVQRAWASLDPARLEPGAALAMRWSSAVALWPSRTGQPG